MNEKAVQTIKDKVFAALFNSRDHIAEIYNEFQPDEKPINPDEISFIKLGKYLDAEHYDAGFLANDSHMILMETQSKLAVSYTVRITISLPELWNNYMVAHHMSMYSRKRVVLPVPEFYVIYTGLDDAPTMFRMSELYERPEGQVNPVSPGSYDLGVRIITETGTGGMLDQYIRFCRIADEMLEKYGATSEADGKTLEKCMEEGVLADILSSLR